MIEKQTFYDSDCLSSFLIIDEGSILKKLFKEIMLPKQVYEELIYEGTPENIKINLKNLIEENFVKIIDIDIGTVEYMNYKNLINGNLNKKIGKGEASAISLAIQNKGILASNNFKDIKYYVDTYELPLLTTAYILGLLVDKKFIKKEKANSMWTEMLKYKRKLPNSSFNEYYEKKYEKDYTDYGKRIK